MVLATTVGSTLQICLGVLPLMSCQMPVRHATILSFHYLGNLIMSKETDCFVDRKGTNDF